MSTTQVTKGDRYTWQELRIEVLRVSKSGAYADIKVTTPAGNEWTKRQPLPFAGGYHKVTS